MQILNENVGKKCMKLLVFNIKKKTLNIKHSKPNKEKI